ncbi:MAG: hypothetical protein V1834_00865 [Candidatus Micrarchaeota archaeon]
MKLIAFLFLAVLLLGCVSNVDFYDNGAQDDSIIFGDDSPPQPPAEEGFMGIEINAAPPAPPE